MQLGLLVVGTFVVGCPVAVGGLVGAVEDLGGRVGGCGGVVAGWFVGALHTPSDTMVRVCPCAFS